ncbi:MAG: hypothetical protein WCB49_08010 [Gammaproteobacteria bacterium]
MADEPQMPEIRLDSGRLYREETYTDRRMGTLRKLHPVHADGSEDPARPVVWEGSTSLMTPAGSLPLNFEIEAETLSEALEKYPDTAREALEHTMEELRELRREQASSIVVPGQESVGLGGAGGGFKPR